MTELHVPPGHHYSPIPAAADVERALVAAEAVGPHLPGIDLRQSEQMAMLRAWQPLYNDLALPLQPVEGHRFHLDNTWFTNADAIGYALMLRAHAPSRVVEVGAGFSSALALDIADRFLDPAPAFTFVDPDPQRLRELARPGEVDDRLLAMPVQDAPAEIFTSLQPGDLLFVDSSHVLKAGSDVQYLLNEVLPLLPADVLIHFHDVFFPFEYPPSWLHRGTAMNEAYAVRALLLGGDRYRVELWNDYLTRFRTGWFAEYMPLFLGGAMPTGGIWLRTLGDR